MPCRRARRCRRGSSRAGSRPARARRRLRCSPPRLARPASARPPWKWRRIPQLRNPTITGATAVRASLQAPDPRRVQGYCRCYARYGDFHGPPTHTDSSRCRTALPRRRRERCPAAAARLPASSSLSARAVLPGLGKSSSIVSFPTGTLQPDRGIERQQRPAGLHCRLIG